MTARILVVEHQATCPPGWIGDWLTRAGTRLVVTRPYLAEELPGDLAAYQGLVVLGGSMGAQDDAAVGWLRPVKSLLRYAASAHLPTLGICLGHQLAAVALGGQVRPNPRGQTMGLQAVPWTGAARADPLFGGLAGSRPARAVQWNDDIVTVAPPGSVALARASTGELLAARWATTVWGVQWHPEVGAGLVSAWAAKDRERAAARGEDVAEHLRAIRDAEPELRDTWVGLAQRFADLVRG